MYQLFLKQTVCLSRCPQLPMVDASCTMQPDPKDPLCCKIPMCTPPPQVGQTTPQYITIPTRVISGGLATPGPSPRPNPNLQPSATPTYYPPVVTVTPSPGPTLYPQPTRQTTQTPAPLPETTPQPVYKRKNYVNCNGFIVVLCKFRRFICSLVWKFMIKWKSHIVLKIKEKKKN